MTGIDGAATAPLNVRPRPVDGPLPDVFTAFDNEFFVEWQVAVVAPAAPEKQILFR